MKRTGGSSFKQFLRLSQSGLTLIELLVVISLITILSGGVALNYAKWNSQQRTRQKALLFKETLRLVQAKAKLGDKGVCGSDSLFGWKIDFTDYNGLYPTSVTYQVACNSSTDLRGPIYKVQFKPMFLSTISSTPDAFFFRPLNLSVYPYNPMSGIRISEPNGNYICSISARTHDIYGPICN